MMNPLKRINSDILETLFRSICNDLVLANLESCLLEIMDSKNESAVKQMMCAIQWNFRFAIGKTLREISSISYMKDFFLKCWFLDDQIYGDKTIPIRTEPSKTQFYIRPWLGNENFSTIYYTLNAKLDVNTAEELQASNLIIENVGCLEWIDMNNGVEYYWIHRMNTEIWLYYTMVNTERQLARHFRRNGFEPIALPRPPRPTA